MRSTILQSLLLVGATVDLVVCDVQPPMPDCVRGCAMQLASNGGIGRELSTACSNSTMQMAVLHCLSTSCALEYSSALVSYLTSCLDFGATLTTVYPVAMQHPGLLPRQFLPISPGPVINVTEDNNNNMMSGIQQDLTITVECNAGPDGILTLSVPDSTTCPLDSATDGQDTNDIRPYPGDGINPAANCDIIRDDPAAADNEPPIVPASEPCESSINTIPTQPGNPAATNAQDNFPSSIPPSATLPLSDATRGPSAACSTNDPAEQVPQTTTSDEQAPAPSPTDIAEPVSDAISSMGVPAESDGGAPTDAAPPETVASTPSQPASTSVESFPSDTTAGNGNEADGSATSEDVPPQTVITVGDSATQQAPASEMTLWPLPLSDSPDTWTTLTTIETSLSIVTDVTTIMATTITFVKAVPPSGWVHYSRTATATASSVAEPLEVTLWPVSTQIFYADEEPDRIEGVVVVTFGSGVADKSQSAVFTASDMEAAISAIPDLVTFPEAAHAIKRDTNADRAYEATNDTLATFLKSTHDFDSEKVVVVPVAGGSGYKVTALTLVLAIVVGQLAIV